MILWPVPMATTPAFHKPRALAKGEPSPLRASSPRNEQGGILALLIEGICALRKLDIASAFTPESAANVVGLSASGPGLASDPTTPASAAYAVPSANASA